MTINPRQLANLLSKHMNDAFSYGVDCGAAKQTPDAEDAATKLAEMILSLYHDLLNLAGTSYPSFPQN